MVVTEPKQGLTVLLLGPLPGTSAPPPIMGSSLPRIQTAPLSLAQEPVGRGEAGPRVAKLHAELFELGYLQKAAVSPYFGVSTDAAVRNFQKSWGLPPDGRVDPLTQRAIDEALKRVREGTSTRARSYTVRQGDSLLRISHALLGDPGRWREILEFNNLSDPSRVVAGTVLKIPPKH